MLASLLLKKDMKLFENKPLSVGQKDNYSIIFSKGEVIVYLSLFHWEIEYLEQHDSIHRPRTEFHVFVVAVKGGQPSQPKEALSNQANVATGKVKRKGHCMFTKQRSWKLSNIINPRSYDKPKNPKHNQKMGEPYFETW